MSRGEGGLPDRGRVPSAAGNPFIRKLAAYAPVSEADRDVLERISAHVRWVPAHVDLVSEGDRPDSVFLILSGFACRQKLRANGARQISALLVPGDLGDLDVASLDAMDHAITTLSACEVVFLAPGVIADLRAHHPRIAHALRLCTLVDVATLREWLLNLGRRSAIERLAHLFCELRVRLQAVGLVTGNGYALPLTQIDLADTTGLTSVHINRSLQELRRQGLIDLRGGRLEILNDARLRFLGEFGAGYLHLRNSPA